MMSYRLLDSNCVKSVAVLLLAGISMMMASGCATTHTSAETAVVADVMSAEDLAPNPNTLMGMAKLLLSQGKHAEAELVLIGLAEKFPGFSPAYSELAAILMGQGRVDDAAIVLSKGVEMVPDEPTLLNDAGVCALVRGDYDYALDKFAAAAELVPSSRRYRANTALALGMLGRFDESIEAYEQVLRRKDAQYNVEIVRGILENEGQ
jgi:Flp pilus assembly protein TadD